MGSRLNGSGRGHGRVIGELCGYVFSMVYTVYCSRLFVGKLSGMVVKSKIFIKV